MHKRLEARNVPERQQNLSAVRRPSHHHPSTNPKKQVPPRHNSTERSEPKLTDMPPNPNCHPNGAVVGGNRRDQNDRPIANCRLTNPRFPCLYVDAQSSSPHSKLNTRVSRLWTHPSYPTFDENPNIVEPDYPTKCVAVLFSTGSETQTPKGKVCPHLSPPKSKK
jgi:hypothetical protein